MSVSVDIDLKDVLKDFAKFEKDVQKAVIDEVKITGFEIESLYKIAVPVDTGRLRSSIHTETAESNSFSYSDNQGQTFNGGFSQKPKNELETFVGSNVQYAAIIENNGGKGQKGKDALKQAAEQSIKGLPDRLSAIINRKAP